MERARVHEVEVALENRNAVIYRGGGSVGGAVACYARTAREVKQRGERRGPHRARPGTPSVAMRDERSRLGP
jgi:hypothetical protein